MVRMSSDTMFFLPCSGQNALPGVVHGDWEQPFLLCMMNKPSCWLCSYCTRNFRRCTESGNLAENGIALLWLIPRSWPNSYHLLAWSCVKHLQDSIERLSLFL